ncbi:MAG: hypothetical protein ACJLS3_09295 [Erythrobacter sp.]
MIYILINLAAIGAATLAGLLIGFIWLRVSGLAVPGWKSLLVAALAEFWLAAILAGALILAPDEAGVWVMALGSAVVIWAGFVVPVLAVTFAAQGLERRQTISASLHWLAVMMAQASLMQAIGLVPPPVG